MKREFSSARDIYLLYRFSGAIQQRYAMQAPDIYIHVFVFLPLGFKQDVVYHTLTYIY
jgi:hypothetical protein